MISGIARTVSGIRKAAIANLCLSTVLASPATILRTLSNLDLEPSSLPASVSSTNPSYSVLKTNAAWISPESALIRKTRLAIRAARSATLERRQCLYHLHLTRKRRQARSALLVGKLAWKQFNWRDLLENKGGYPVTTCDTHEEFVWGRRFVMASLPVSSVIEPFDCYGKSPSRLPSSVPPLSNLSGSTPAWAAR